MKYIPLTNGGNAIIDNEDYKKVSKYKWFRVKGDGRESAHMTKKKTNSMHRFLMNPPKDLVVDHKNGNGLDNRRYNLRICTYAENSRNAKKNIRNTSGYKGVIWHKASKKWSARINYNYRRISLGYYNDVIDAANAYDAAAKELFGEYAKLNNA